MTFEALYRENAKRVYNYASRRLCDKGHAPDVMQETFLAALVNQETVLSHVSPVAWLTLTAKRRIIYYNTKYSRGEEVALEDDIPVTPGTAYWEWLPPDLSDVDQEIARLLYDRQLMHSEIAAVVGLSLSACQSRIRRLNQRIKECILGQTEGKEVSNG